jgi:hypothetical protein
MLNLNDLKTRLEKLPERRNLRKYALTFDDFTKKLGESYDKMKQINKDMVYASKVNSNNEYETKILFELKKAVREAKKIYKEISVNPEKVTSTAIANGIGRIDGSVVSAKKKCKEIWENEMKSIDDKWEKMADAVQKLDTEGGCEFKQIVDRLRGRTIPQNDKEVDQIKADKEGLQKSIANLGLAGSFGKFIEASVEGGASLKALLENDEIKKKLDEYNLWDNFRIRLLG